MRREPPLILTLLAAGCASMYNADLEPAAKMRPGLFATVTWPAPARTQARLGELLRPLGIDIPIVPLATGIAHKGSLELIDGNRPVADAYVVGEVDGRRALQVATVMDARSTSDADSLADNLHDLNGRFHARIGLSFATVPQNPGGGPAVGGQYVSTRSGERGPTHVVGQSVATASSEASLSAAGALAREAQRALPGDLVIHLEAAGWARLHTGNPDLRRMLALEADGDVARRLARLPPGTSPQDRALAEKILRIRAQPLIDFLGDLTDLDATLDLGEPGVVQVTVVMRPRAGSALAASVAAMRRVPLEPSWIAPDPVLVAALDWSWGPFPQREREIAAWAAGGGTGAGALQAQLAVEKQSFAGPALLAAYAPDGKLAVETVLPLRPGADGDALLAAVEAGFQGKGADTMDALLAGERVNGEGITREGKRLRIANSTARPRDGVLDPLRSAPLTMITVARQALVTLSGFDAGERLDALEGSPAPSPAVDALLGLARGSDGWAFVDLVGLGLPFSATAEPGSFLKVFSTIPGLSQQHLPLLATLKGGRELTLRVTVPRQALAGLLAFVGPFLGRGTLGAR